MNEALEQVSTSTDSKRAPRDTTHNDIRQEVRQILTRSNLTVEKTITGKTPNGPVVTFQVSGDGVKAPFNRYYLGKKLEKRLANSGYTADLRRKDRGVDSILVDVFAA